MSIFWGLFDKLTGVVGLDCDGRHLRVGDRVCIVDTEYQHKRYRGFVTQIIGARGEVRKSVLLARKYPEMKLSAMPNCLRRIDSDGKGDWGSVTKSTGWKPNAEKRPVTTPGATHD